MRCPVCSHLASRVVDSRPAPEGQEVRRRRECEICHHRFTTYERLEGVVPMVVKRDGRRESFDREKVRRALRTACRKRAISADRIEEIGNRVAMSLESGGAREVPSSDIGDQLLKELSRVDEVAYARFASVYKRFNSIADFRSLLSDDEGATPDDDDSQEPGDSP